MQVRGVRALSLALVFYRPMNNSRSQHSKYKEYIKESMTIIYYLALIELEITLNYLRQFLK